jgi:hypothetical protein
MDHILGAELMLPISSYAIIMNAALLHLIEGLILLGTRSADGSIGLHSLLGVIPDPRGLAAALIASSSAAFVVVTKRYLPPWLTVILLTPQQAFLLTTGIAAWLAVWHGIYADGVVRSSFFITADQLPRGMFSLVHLTAMYTLAQMSSFSARRSKLWPVRLFGIVKSIDQTGTAFIAFRIPNDKVSSRDAVLAVRGWCAISFLPEPRLLDAAHIVMDADEQLRQPIICWRNHITRPSTLIIGIEPVLPNSRSDRLLEIYDCPFLELGPNWIDGTLIIGKTIEHRPDCDRPAIRFEQFRNPAVSITPAAHPKKKRWCAVTIGPRWMVHAQDDNSGRRGWGRTPQSPQVSP